MGGLGADTLSGGAGRDTYRYGRIADSSAGGGDSILDFDGVGGAPGDRIDLSAVDANVSRGGRQSFSFVTTDLIRPGQLHVVDASGGAGSIVEGEVDGRPGTDFSLAVADGGAVAAADWVAGDFIL